MKTKHKIIIDRKSSYSVTSKEISSNEELKDFIKEIERDKKLKKATHNSYAFRYINKSKLFEGKNDGGENGAGNIILHYLKTNDLKNIIVIVSRYYGGIKLGSDRFKNIQHSLKIFFK